MAQYAGGKLRLVAKDSSGRIKATTPFIDYTIYDNAAAPRVVFSDAYFGTAQGTSDDQVVTTPGGFIVDGSQGDYMDVEMLHTAAMTTHVSASDAYALNVVEVYKDHLGIIHADDKTLFVGDRVTKSTSGTQNHPNGFPDDVENLANIPSVLTRFMPAFGKRWSLRGHQQITLDGT